MKLVNKTGYLKGAKTAKNPVNIIPSNLITTQGMAFPIKANGKTLYPNTGQYKFPTSHVVETPLKKKGTKSTKTFGEAFNEASKAGKDTFEYNGKPFNTKKKEQPSWFNTPIQFGKEPNSIGSYIGKALSLGQSTRTKQGYSVTPSSILSPVKNIENLKDRVIDRIKTRIIDRVKPSTYDIPSRVQEFLTGEIYNPYDIDPKNDAGYAADQDVLALSLGKKPRNNAVVKQNINRPISDKSKNTEYYSIPSLNKRAVIENYTDAKKVMDELDKKYPKNIEYGIKEKIYDMIPNFFKPVPYRNKEHGDKKNLEDYRKKGVIYQNDDNTYKDKKSFGPMGTFGTWKGKDKKGRYISYKDKIDYEGSLLGKIIAPMLDQKKVNIYDKIYYKEGSKGVSLAFSKGEKDPKGGLTQKGVDKYNRATGGNLKMAVTTPPSKLKAGSKAANRRKSFCARMGGMPGPMKKPNGEPSRKALALRKWNC